LHGLDYLFAFEFTRKPCSDGWTEADGREYQHTTESEETGSGLKTNGGIVNALEIRLLFITIKAPWAVVR
jgi:hypothetical protein